MRRRDLPPVSELPGITPEKYERATYRLHVIGSDVTSGRMVILPDDLPAYEDRHGKPFDKDSFPIVDAVRMSMSYPFLFNPVTRHKSGKPYYVVDGGLLSNFPIWLFDSPNPKRPTWGFRLHLSKQDAHDLYGWGENAALAFFTDPQQQEYLNSFGKTIEPGPAEKRTPAGVR